MTDPAELARWLIDIATVVIVLEAFMFIFGPQALARARVTLNAWLPNLAAGLALLLAARAVLMGATWPWLPICLIAAGLAHAMDLRRRWPPPARGAPPARSPNPPAAR